MPPIPSLRDVIGAVCEVENVVSGAPPGKYRKLLRSHRELAFSQLVAVSEPLQQVCWLPDTVFWWDGASRGRDRVIDAPVTHTATYVLQGPRADFDLRDGRLSDEMLVCAFNCLYVLHRLGFAHGDFHPGNALVFAGPDAARVVLCDFETTAPVGSAAPRGAAGFCLCPHLEPAAQDLLAWGCVVVLLKTGEYAFGETDGGAPVVYPETYARLARFWKNQGGDDGLRRMHGLTESRFWDALFSERAGLFLAVYRQRAVTCDQLVHTLVPKRKRALSNT